MHTTVKVSKNNYTIKPHCTADKIDAGSSYLYTHIYSTIITVIYRTYKALYSPINVL